MQNQALILAGGGGLVVGVLLAVAISGARVDTKLDAALADAGEASAAALEEATSALEARIAELEGALSEATSGAAAETEGRLSQLSEEIGQRLEMVAQEAQTRAQDLETTFGALMARVAAMGQAATEAPVPMDMDTRGPLGVGETAIFMDGALRAFVSALDGEAGSARLNVNGETVTVALGETVSVAVAEEECTLALAALDASGATVGAACGGDAASAATEAAGSGALPAPENGFRPGSVAILADGALRVFVSGLAADGSSARIAVNGIDTETVSAGGSVSQQVGDKTCEVTVTGVGKGMVGLEGACG